MGHDVSDVNQIPVLEPVQELEIPNKIIAFNQRGRAQNVKETGLHFFVNDTQFRSVLQQPNKFLEPFSPFPVILTPDISLLEEMPEWLRIQRTHLSRSIGVYYQLRQFKVIPTLRWISISDLDFVLEGLQKHSVVAVGALGNYRDLKLRAIFEGGLNEIVDRLSPKAILVYGSIRPEFHQQLDRRTRVIVHKTYMSEFAQIVKDPEFEEGDLFSKRSASL